MFLVRCSLKIASYFFAIKPFGFSVLAATENESAESFDTSNCNYNCLFLRGQRSHFRIVFENFMRQEVE